MDKSLMAFIVLIVVLIADVFLMAFGVIATEVGVPVLTGAAMAAIALLFPAPQ